jgi:hypothetical protein
MNVYAMSQIVHTSSDDVVAIMRHIRDPRLLPEAMRHEVMQARRTVSELGKSVQDAGFDDHHDDEEGDYLRMMQRLRNDPSRPAPDPSESEAESTALVVVEPFEPRNTEMNFEVFQDVLELFQVHESDMDILYSLFRLIDKRGYKTADIGDVLIAFLAVTAANARECITIALKVYNIARVATTAHAAPPETINRKGLIHILMQLNSACYFFGDRVMEPRFVEDLCDSVIAAALPAIDHAGSQSRTDTETVAMMGMGSAERINKDGPVAAVDLLNSTGEEIDRLFIPYREFIDLICEHPVVEMMLSVQYQGSVKDKMQAVK